MTAMGDGRSIPELLGDLSRDVSGLFRKEIQLARAETSETIGRMMGAVTTILIGGVLAIGALGVLLQAAVIGLTALGMAPGLAAVIVGVVVALIAYLMIQQGMKSLEASNLIPRRTLRTLEKDAQVVKEQTR